LTIISRVTIPLKPIKNEEWKCSMFGMCDLADFVLNKCFILDFRQ